MTFCFVLRHNRLKNRRGRKEFLLYFYDPDKQRTGGELLRTGHMRLPEPYPLQANEYRFDCCQVQQPDGEE